LPPETVKLTDTVFVAFAMRVMAEPLFMARAERARGLAETVTVWASSAPNTFPECKNKPPPKSIIARHKTWPANPRKLPFREEGIPTIIPELRNY
jgi:hypothetical protein